jgi:hypothetical protein
MRPLLGIGLTLLFSSVGLGSVPNCWDPSVVEGSYLITIDTAKVTKEQLVFVLELARSRFLEPQQFPYVFSKYHYLYFETRAVDNDVEKMPREQLRREVESQLRPLDAMPGVSISCSPSERPVTP